MVRSTAPEWLLYNKSIVTWTNLSINCVQVTSLLTLDRPRAGSESSKLYGSMPCEQVTADCEVCTRCNINSKVICLEDLLRVQDLLVYLNNRIIIVQLMDICLLMLAQS